MWERKLGRGQRKKQAEVKAAVHHPALQLVSRCSNLSDSTVFNSC